MTPGFDELFAAHHRKVFRAAYRVTGSTQDAEDILQSVFLRLLQRRDGLEGGGDNPAGYLCRSAINASIDLLRSRARSPGESLIEEMHASEDGADDGVRQAEIRKQLRTAMLALEPGTAEVFALRYFEEFSNREIAVLLDTTPNSVAVTLHRARARLQDLLGEFTDS
ncbi:MAG: sigma-70 family RNA polymerase sigma factor [Gammaproteobacteria bacterium]